MIGAGLAVAALANLAIGAGTGVGGKTFLLAILIGLLPAIVIAFGALIDRHRALLAWAALALNLTNIPFLGAPLPLPGGTSVFPTDILLLLAVGSWLAARLTRPAEVGHRRIPLTFSWPLAVLVAAIMSGVLIGHSRYGASIIAQPFRLVLYAGIGLALLDVAPKDAWRAITRVFYAGAALQAVFAAYYLAMGGSQTTASVLSTGGTRVLALSVSIYLTGSFVCALLNLEVDRHAGRQFQHLLFAALALFGIVVAFGRTTYAAVALILPLLFFSRRYLRRTVLLLVPLLAPAVVLVLLVLPSVAPNMIPTLQDRLFGTTSNDTSLRWREEAISSSLEGIEDQRLTGLGFGRVSHFELNGQAITIQGDPHNSYVYLLAGGGLLALGAFLLLCGVYVADALVRLRRSVGVESAILIWSLATWVAFMVNAFAGPILSDPTMMMTIWVLMALPGLVARRAAPVKEPAADQPLRARTATARS